MTFFSTILFSTYSFFLFFTFCFFRVALDPAQPGFEYCPDDVRLKKTDAEFVDVLHTNTRPIIPLLGFGLILPTGKLGKFLEPQLRHMYEIQNSQL